MARDWRVVTGMAVLALGVMAAITVAKNPSPPEIEPNTFATVVAAPEPVGTAPSPQLPGVPNAVTRVLGRNGNVGFAGPTTSDHLPAAVVDALVAHDVPLAIPSDVTTP